MPTTTVVVTCHSESIDCLLLNIVGKQERVIAIRAGSRIATEIKRTAPALAVVTTTPQPKAPNVIRLVISEVLGWFDIENNYEAFGGMCKPGFNAVTGINANEVWVVLYPLT